MFVSNKYPFARVCHKNSGIILRYEEARNIPYWIDEDIHEVFTSEIPFVNFTSAGGFPRNKILAFFRANYSARVFLLVPRAESEWTSSGERARNSAEFIAVAADMPLI